MENITQVEKKFIDEYIKNLDAEGACKIAGYGKYMANQLLEDKRIINAIRKELANRATSLRIEKGYIVQHLVKIIEFSLEVEDVLDKENIPTGKQKLRDTTLGLKALEMLCKNTGLNGDEKITTNEPKIITIANLDKNKL